MAWGTESRRDAFLAVGLGAALLIVLLTLWRFPSAELIVFHVVWLGLAVLTLRGKRPLLRTWLLVGMVSLLAIAIEVDDVASGNEGAEGLVEIPLDLTAFVALVMLAGRHRAALQAEHAAAVAEHDTNVRQHLFFANASHALRTPITVARGHAEVAMMNSSEPAVRDDMQIVLDELDGLTNTTDRILHLTVADDMDESRKHLVDVDRFLRWTGERWSATADRTWVVEPRTGGLQLIASSADLSIALDSLIENAVRATSTSSTITVRSRIEGDEVVLSVSDDGHGIGDIDPERLFDAFQQGPRRNPDVPRGTGLGLAIVRAVASAHGGTAHLFANEPNGTVVEIRLPIHAGANSELPRTTDAVAPTPAARPAG